MNLRERLLAIDALVGKSHLTLNRIATEKVVHGEEVHRAIADLTLAREKLTDLAEEPPLN